MSIAIMNERIIFFAGGAKYIPFQLISIQWGGGVIIDCINLFGGGGGEGPFPLIIYIYILIYIYGQAPHHDPPRAVLYGKTQ